MTDDFDYEGFVKRQRAKVASRFRHPDVEAFESKFGCQIPPALLRLYNLGEALMESPGEVLTGRHLDSGIYPVNRRGGRPL